MLTFSLHLRSVFYVTGLLVCVTGIGMIGVAGIELAIGAKDWLSFLVSAAVTLFIGSGVALSSRPRAIEFGLRDGMVLTALSWVVIAAVAALPLMLSAKPLSFTDAYFETMSALTTTGSTVIVGLDDMPPGVLLWRSVLQAFGGMGIIVFAIALLPFLRVGGMQLFRLESSDKSEKALPRTSEIAASIIGIYFGLIALCALSYALSGMSLFDAANHAMTTVATGGFSTSDASLGAWEKHPGVHWTAFVFMAAGALPFTLYLRVAQGRWDALMRDGQVRAFFGLMALAIAATSVWLIATGRYGVEPAIRHAAVNLMSVVTTTGYATVDYMQWGSFPIAIFFFLTLVGGCTGSTSGGLKIFRLQVLAALVAVQFRRFVHPNGVYVARHKGKPIGDDVAISVLVFVLVYLATIGAVTLAIAAMGVDLVTALTGTMQAIGNVGPGLGDIVGPAGNFSTLPAGAKWLLALAMLIGRLELFTFLVLFTPHFWRA
ncbi:MAG: TrkH family potassium uptake protein [Alphaproteobacteria bacterium]|nr:TrkH family potassium uptake protein [Alphaproteobacteria bacterium]